jgi:hypothetical protein
MVCHQPLIREHVEVHHLTPQAEGGSDDLTNLVLVHTFCHQQIHNGALDLFAVVVAADVVRLLNGFHTLRIQDGSARFAFRPTRSRSAACRAQ